MVPFKVQIILLIIALVVLFIVINMIRKYRLELKYSLLWLTLNITIIVFILFPNLLSGISFLIGIETPSNTLFLFGMMALMAIMFSLTTALSRYSNKIKELTQELGLLKQQFQELKQQKTNSNRTDGVNSHD
jgi:hypothetical protein